MHSLSSPPKAIFFDFGSTLIYTKDPWPPIYVRADRALLGRLNSAGIPLELNQFSSEFETFLDNYYADRGTSVIEKTTFSALKEILSMKGFPDVPEPTLRIALDALYAVTQKNWHLEKEALPTLKILQKRGLRLGMISNTSDEVNVQQLLDRWGLRPYFEHIITSAGCGFRKPDERIFRLALDKFNLPPEQAVMVGDSPEADILGAHRLGIYSIWIIRRVENSDPGPIPPDAVVQNLSEIPSLIPGFPSSS